MLEFNVCLGMMVVARRRGKSGPTREEVAGAMETFEDVGGEVLRLPDGPQPQRLRVNPTHSENTTPAYEEFDGFID